ncbi:GntR family transcriptional regulator [Nocardioides sp. LHD-245]|uniref:GntR family transcriptional regulator n=1 Tax=Nocardioides sp. LHD-245 TaxID=3051387 RepID=UPI0027E17707|nr:GntR family transcriptional regulator [Nocardioides sp. LHD-245]
MTDQPEKTMPSTSGGPGGAIERINLKSQVLEVLRTAIFSGELAPGVVHTNGELAARYGVSRTPVREAVLELESKGLVTIARGVGFRIVAPSDDESRELNEMRQVLEGWAMSRIAGELSDEALVEAEAMLARVTAAAEAADLTAYWAQDRAFHDFLVRQAGNVRLATLLSDYRDSQRIPVLARIAREGNLPARNVDHVRLLDAIRAGEKEAAGDLIRAHIGLNLESAGA